MSSRKFLTVVPMFERMMVESGIILLKYWLEVSAEEQTRRLQDRIDDGRKLWKLSPMDLKSYNRWDDYTRARDDMFAASDSSWAPWFMARSEDKRKARLNIISHLLQQVPYKDQPQAEDRAAQARQDRQVQVAALPVQDGRRALLKPGPGLASGPVQRFEPPVTPQVIALQVLRQGQVAAVVRHGLLAHFCDRLPRPLAVGW
jgi:hypothetical protein